MSEDNVIDPNKGWVIVLTAAGNYIGKDASPPGSKIDNPNYIKLDPAFTWINDQVMVAPGQMAMMRQAVPLQGSLDASKLDIREYVAIQKLDEWPDHTRSEILRQVNSVIDGMKAESARQAGIAIPQTQVPSDLAQKILSQK